MKKVLVRSVFVFLLGISIGFSVSAEVQEETLVKIYEMRVTYKQLNYEQFKKWGELFLYKQKVSGNYSTEELYQFRKRYEEILKVFEGDEDVVFMVNDDGDFYVVK